MNTNQNTPGRQPSDGFSRRTSRLWGLAVVLLLGVLLLLFAHNHTLAQSKSPTPTTAQNTVAPPIHQGATSPVHVYQPAPVVPPSLNSQPDPATSLETPPAPDFDVSASPSSLTIVAISGDPSSSGSSTITVTPLNGFTGDVALTVSGQPSGVTASLSPTSVTLGPASTSTLTVSTDPTTTPDTYTLTVTGTSGSLTHTATIKLIVKGPDFSLSADPASITAKLSASGSSTITVSPVLNYTGTVTLSVSGQPSGVTATLAPTSITLGTAATTKLSVSVDKTAAPGSYALNVTGTSGKLKHTAVVTLVIPDFILTASPLFINLHTGGIVNGSSTISVIAVNGFTGDVSLAVSGQPSGATATLDQSIVTLGTLGSSTLSVSIDDTVTPGTYSLTVTGTSGDYMHTATVYLTVSPPDFSLSADPTSFTLIVGQSASATLSIYPDGASNFPGTSLLLSPASLVVSPLPATPPRSQSAPARPVRSTSRLVTFPPKAVPFAK